MPGTDITVSSNQAISTTLTIAANDATGASNALQLQTQFGTVMAVGFQMPVLPVAANLVLEISLDNGMTWLSTALSALGSAWNTYPTSVQTAGTYQAIDPASMLGATAIRFVSGSAATPVVQTSAVSINVMTRAVH